MGEPPFTGWDQWLLDMARAIPQVDLVSLTITSIAPFRLR